MQREPLLDRLVGAQQERPRARRAARLGALKIDDETEPGHVLLARLRDSRGFKTQLAYLARITDGAPQMPRWSTCTSPDGQVTVVNLEFVRMMTWFEEPKHTIVAFSGDSARMTVRETPDEIIATARPMT